MRQSVPIFLDLPKCPTCGGRHELHNRTVLLEFIQDKHHVWWVCGWCMQHQIGPYMDKILASMKAVGEDKFTIDQLQRLVANYVETLAATVRGWEK